MHPAAVLDALVDGVGFVRSRATTLNQGLLSDSTGVILVSQLVGWPSCGWWPSWLVSQEVFIKFKLLDKKFEQ
jgi:hypothetical protein